jgi:hypothetical protein
LIFTDESTCIYIAGGGNAITAVCYSAMLFDWLCVLKSTRWLPVCWHRLILVLFYTPNKNRVAQQINNNGIFLLVALV